MVRRSVQEQCWDFIQPLTITSTNTVDGWTRGASAGGTPTIATVDGDASGAIALTLDNTNESQVQYLYWGDTLSLDIDLLHSFEFVAKVGSIAATTTLCMGLSGDVNSVADSMAQNAWFRMEGSASTSAVVVETDDGTTDNDDKATGQTLASTYKRFLIDFQNGTSDVRFYMDNGSGQLTRVAASTTFDMSGYTGSLQPMFFLAKSSGTTTPSVTIDLVKVTYKAA